MLVKLTTRSNICKENFSTSVDEKEWASLFVKQCGKRYNKMNERLFLNKEVLTRPIRQFQDPLLLGLKEFLSFGDGVALSHEIRQDTVATMYNNQSTDCSFNLCSSFFVFETILMEAWQQCTTFKVQIVL